MDPRPDAPSPGHAITLSPPHPTPAQVLGWVLAGPRPWFPSRQAAAAGVPRDALDEPLNGLRRAGLVQVVDWVRGVGQGYAPTPAGEKLAPFPDRVARAVAGEPVESPAAPPPAPAAAPAPRPPRRRSGLTTFDRGELARKAVLDPPPAVLTPLLAFLCGAWFLVGLFVAWRAGLPVDGYFRGAEGQVLHDTGAVTGTDLLHGEWWRLASACFVHVGALHLLLNMYALFAAGSLAEGLWGRWRFAAIYAAGGLGGSCLAMALRPDGLLAGASGAIWGVMTSVVAWVLLYRRHLPEQVVAAWLRRLLVVLGLNALISLAPGISWEGHLGGGLAGFATAVLTNAARRGNGWRALAGGGLAAVVPVGCVAGLAGAMYRTDRWERLWAVAQVQQFVEQAAADGRLVTVRPERVEAVYADVATAAVVGGNRAKAAKKAAALAADARAAAGVAAALGGGSRYGFLAPVARPAGGGRPAGYLAAVADLADALVAVCDDPTPARLEEAARRRAAVLKLATGGGA